MFELGLRELVILALAVYVPWGITTVWWYAALVYYTSIHREEHNVTDDFAVKVLTTGDDGGVLTGTVLFSNKEPLVISRKHVPLPRGDVKVLPETFQCRARFKGQQLEWARREFPAHRTLFLDEDSLCDLHVIPVADIVQFQEVPQGKSKLIAAIEAYRMGFQIEQALFEKTGPLFLWGGGVAVSQDLEDDTTWNRPTVTEDTAFLYATRRPFTYRYSKKRIYDQAPPSIEALIKQRWRWASGTFRDTRYLPWGWRRIFIYFRTLQWGLWPASMLAPAILGAPYWMTLPLLLQAIVWSFVGARVMGLTWKDTVLTVLAMPVASVIHSLGATMALVKPVNTFHRTPKVAVRAPAPLVAGSASRKSAVHSTNIS